MSDATDVLQAIDQLRRDLSGYHGQLKAHNDLQRHCDHQRERIVELEAIHARDKVENAKLRKFVLTLAFCANDEADCDQCPMNGAHCDVVQQCFCDGVAEALHELGIEVDGIEVDK